MKTIIKYVAIVGALGAYTVGLAQTNTFPSTGNVGIGTTSPTRLLSLNGAANAYLGFKIGDTAESTIGSDGNGDFFVYDDQTSAYRLVVDTGGNIGIGTTSPNGRLSVATSYQSVSFLSGTGVGSGNVALLLDDNSNGGTANRWEFLTRVTEGGFSIANRGDNAVRFHIDDIGNVGIGTANPGAYKLAVAGKIHAQEVVVDLTGWSDYVFADDYRLAPLSEVESHIRANKHLPGIPSAATVAAGGVSLGDMQAKLLAKVEELTLHQIAQEKRLTEQDTRIQRLEAENDALRNH